MYPGRDFDDIESSETDVFSFDFKRLLASGETIIGATWTCGVASDSTATDASPASRLLGSPFTDPTTPTITSQRCGNFLAGVRYLLEAAIPTSNGNTKAMHAHVTCRAPD